METQIQSLGWEDPLEKEMATHSRFLAWKMLWTEEPGKCHGQRRLAGYRPRGRKESDMAERLHFQLRDNWIAHEKR